MQGLLGLSVIYHESKKIDAFLHGGLDGLNDDFL